MSVPSGRLQFFALEASDYLERLGMIVSRPASPPPDGNELVRLSRALRGSALMAGLGPFAHAAAGLEAVAKAHRDDPSTWSTPKAEAVADAVEEFKRLSRLAGEWTDRETESASRLTRELVDLAGLGPPPPPPPPPADDDELKPSVRAFIGREGALIAGTLEHSARAIELDQAGAAHDVVLQRLQPLRGLAAVPGLSPLPEFLDAIELTIRSIRDQAAPPDGPRALRLAAVAVSTLSRNLAETGAAGADAPDIALGAVSLLEAFGRDDDIVEIGSLFRAGDLAPVVSIGSPPGRDQAPDPTLEVVSLADRLRQAADQLGQPASATGRTLYLYGLLVELRALNRDAPRERPHLAGTLTAIIDAIGHGRAGHSPAQFATELRAVADLLNRAAQARDTIFLADEMAPVIESFRRLEGPPADVVPIESLAPSLTTFEQSFSTYHRLAMEPVEIAPEPVAAPAPEPEEPAIPIANLLYRGRRALERADRVRLDLSDALKQQRSFTEIEPMVSELIDLVPLALAE